MKVIAVDDERIALNSISEKLRKVPEISSVETFLSPLEALAYLEKADADIAFLDINMRHMDGLSLAKRVKELRPHIFVVFLTGYSEYAAEAFRLHAAGYLMKPAGMEDILDVLHCIENPPEPPRTGKSIRVQTFGNFEVFADGKPVRFSRNKSKELLAYLVDRRGTSATLAEVASILWEDGMYDRSRQKQLQTFIHAMQKDLESAGIGRMVLKSRTGIMVDQACFDCDYYEFLAGDVCAINSYSGEYMNAYSWAEFTVSRLEKKLAEGAEG